MMKLPDVVVLAAVASVLALVALSFVHNGTVAVAALAAPGTKWLLNGPAVAEFAKDPFARGFFENAQPFVIERKGDVDRIPDSWDAIPVRSFTSYADLKKALEQGSIDAHVRAILYDNEAWTFTPEEEQRDPARYMKSAADAVHAKGLLFITTPAVNLARVLAPGNDKRYDAYLQLGLAADAARYADVYEIQAQGSEKNAVRFAGFVRAAAQQARAANPKVIVLAGISTNPNGQRVSASQVEGAIEATRAFVDGYWFNVPRPSEYCPGCNDFRPDIAIDVLRRLATSTR